MENKNTVKISILIFTALLIATPLFVFAYDDDTTHAALTEEIIEFFMPFIGTN